VGSARFELASTGISLHSSFKSRFIQIRAPEVFKSSPHKRFIIPAFETILVFETTKLEPVVLPGYTTTPQRLQTLQKVLKTKQNKTID